MRLSYRQADLLDHPDFKDYIKTDPWVLNIYATPTQAQAIFSIDPKYRHGVELEIDPKYTSPLKNFNVIYAPNAGEIQYSIPSSNPDRTVRLLIVMYTSLGLTNQIPEPNNSTGASTHMARFQIPAKFQR